MRTRRQFGSGVVLALLLALPLWSFAADVDEEDGGPEPGLPEPAAVEPHVVAPNPGTPAAIPAPAMPAPAAPHQRSPAAGAAPPPPEGLTVGPPATNDSPKRLGRPFPTPVTPPPPPEDPEVHVTIVPSGESKVGQNRIRGGGEPGAAATADEGGDHPGE